MDRLGRHDLERRCYQRDVEHRVVECRLRLLGTRDDGRDTVV